MKKIRKAVYAVTALLLAAACLVGAFALNTRADSPRVPDCDIIYDFGNGQAYEIKSGLAMSMMRTNPDGSYYVNPESGSYELDPAKMNGFFYALSMMYPMQSNDLLFRATRGDVVQISGGSQKQRFLDTGVEIPYLANAIMTGKKEVHTPVWGIGGTYIEVDMTNQHLYYYLNNALVTETPIVTGNVRAGHKTPTGVYYVNSKLRNINLVGPGYVSFVNYWMAVIGSSIGIHDATWRSSFGGDIYLTNGSHGCINVPLTVIKDLYPLVEKGTIVVMFY
ncbi:MAG: L,D-transpeptidase [Lachnospiraceae bacterium]|nr:L,D-transpeptidase [Lachnospiraceae bacterium]